AVRSNPRLYGGLIVHVGVVIAAVAIATSSAYSTKREVRLTQGRSATVRGYTLTYTGSHEKRSGQKNTVTADVRIRRGGDDLGTYAPAISTFPNASQGIGTPSVRTGLREDVYLTLVSSPNQQGRVTIGVALNPMVLWLWVGGGVMAAGTLLALSPSLRRRTMPGEGPVPAVPPTPGPGKGPVGGTAPGGSRSRPAPSSSRSPSCSPPRWGPTRALTPTRATSSGRTLPPTTSRPSTAAASVRPTSPARS